MSELDFTSTMGEAFDSATTEEIAAPAAEPVAAPAKEITEQPEAAPVEAAAQAKETPDQGTGKEGEPAAAQPVEPPARWSADDKAAFAALTPEAQKLVLKRESDIEKHLTQKSQEFADKSKSVEQLDQILAPREQAWAMNGMTKVQAVNQLLAISDYANRNPEQFVRDFARERGIDLTQTATHEGAASVDPVLAATQQRLNQVEQHFQNLETQRNQSIIDAFKSEPGHEHFEDVRDHMAALLHTQKAKDMNDAYDQAVWANPVTRGKLLADQQAQAESKRMADAVEAAAKAKNANVTRISGETSAKADMIKGTTWKETMSNAYDAHQGAA